MERPREGNPQVIESRYSSPVGINCVLTEKGAYVVENESVFFFNRPETTRNYRQYSPHWLFAVIEKKEGTLVGENGKIELCRDKNEILYYKLTYLPLIQDDKPSSTN